MSKTKQYRVEPLDPSKHRREDFSCESEVLNEFLKKRARQEMRARASACFVLVNIADPSRIVGYYTLSATSIQLGLLPPSLRKKLPRYDELGATLIGRMARDLEFSRERVGEKLLMSALYRAYREASVVGSVAVVVDTKESGVAGFYRRFGFREPGDGRMWLAMRDVPIWNPSVAKRRI